MVLAGSASEFIFRLTAWMHQCGHSRFWTPPQAYGDYAHAADAWNLQRSDALADAELVWACEPSSPLGQAHTAWPVHLQQANAAMATNAGTHRATADSMRPTVVLDGAYAPLRLSGTPSLDAAQADQVWRLFSPNKALCLTGIRAAYAIAPVQARAAAHQLDAMAPSWAVGAHGEAMLLAWTADAVQRWLHDCLPTLRTWKAQQVALLQGLGWQCLPSDANFFCARPPASTDLPALLQHLRTHGIKLRDATSLGLPGQVRLSAQPPLAQQALHAGITNFGSFQ
jgi:histidinol-phosphate aminotransferase